LTKKQINLHSLPNKKIKELGDCEVIDKQGTMAEIVPFKRMMSYLKEQGLEGEGYITFRRVLTTEGYAYGLFVEDFDLQKRIDDYERNNK